MPTSYWCTGDPLLPAIPGSGLVQAPVHFVSICTYRAGEVNTLLETGFAKKPKHPV